MKQMKINEFGDDLFFYWIQCSDVSEPGPGAPQTVHRQD